MITRRRFFGVLAAPFVVGLLAARPDKPKPIAFDPSKMRVFLHRNGQEIELHGARVISIEYDADRCVHADVSVPIGLVDLVNEQGSLVISHHDSIQGLTLKGAVTA